MSIRTVLTKMTLFFLLEVFANLGFVVVIRNVEHLVLHLDRKLLYTKNTKLIAFKKYENLAISEKIKRDYFEQDNFSACDNA